MAKKMKPRVQFFKVMMNNFAQQLLLPPEFMRKYGDLLPEDVKIRCSTGKIWNVKLQRMEGENRCSFTRGWSKFAEDFKLKRGEFVEFIFDVAKSTFDVSVWGANCVEREISGKRESENGVELDKGNEVKSEDDDDDDDKEEEEEEEEEETPDNTVEEVNPHFKIKLKDHHSSRVSLHQQFSKDAGLMGHQAVTLKYPPKERCWPVVLDNSPLYRIDLAWGWTDFRKGNKLVFGNTYLFEYIRDENVIEVKPIKGDN